MKVGLLLSLLTIPTLWSFGQDFKKEGAQYLRTGSPDLTEFDRVEYISEQSQNIQRALETIFRSNSKNLQSGIEVEAHAVVIKGSERPELIKLQSCLTLMSAFLEKPDMRFVVRQDLAARGFSGEDFLILLNAAAGKRGFGQCVTEKKGLKMKPIMQKIKNSPQQLTPDDAEVYLYEHRFRTGLLAEIWSKEVYADLPVRARRVLTSYLYERFAFGITCSYPIENPTDSEIQDFLDSIKDGVNE